MQYFVDNIFIKKAAELVVKIVKKEFNILDEKNC